MLADAALDECDYGALDGLLHAYLARRDVICLDAATPARRVMTIM
jgi:hypothetical protein